MVRIIGHRGAAGHAPENTLLSFQKAINFGCDRAELDVWLSKDKEVVVFHDLEVSRVTDGMGAVDEYTLAELKHLRLAEGQKIPTLQEVIDLCKGKIDLQIELKGPGTAQAVYELLQKNNFTKNVVVISFNAAFLKEMRELDSSLTLGFLFDEYSSEVWQTVEELSLNFIAPKGKIVTKEMVDEAHSRGLFVYAYHVDTKELGEKLIALGADEIGTDFPDLFV